MARDIFNRLGQPPLINKAQEISQAQQLLDWLQSWNKNTICTRDICNYGPYAVRGRERAITAAETLMKYGWLVPAAKHRRDMHKWEIVRRPIVRPMVESSSNVAD